MTDGNQAEGSLFLYAPNKGGAIFFTVAFSVTAALHMWQCQKYKSWKITSLYPFTGLTFAAGFACRSYGAFHFDNIPVYIASQCLIYMAPPLVELANYHVLGRVLYYVPYCTPMHPGRVLTTFGGLSALVEILNAIGIAWLASPGADADIRKAGEHLSQAALVLQLVVVSSFVVLALLFHHRCRRAGVAAARGVRFPLLTLYASTALVLVRTVYRVVEHFGAGPTRLLEPGFAFADLSPVWRYEAFFFAFEATLMLLNLALWNASHPRRYLPQDYHVYLAQDGSTELVGPGWESTAPFWITLVDPFGFMQCTRDRERKAQGGHKTPFWEENGHARKTSSGTV